MKHGKCALYYPNGKKEQEGEWTNGEAQEEGTYTFYYESGRKKSVGNYKGGVLRWYSAWHKNGNLNQQGGRKGDKMSGKYTWWYENGVKSQEANYDRNGNRHGAYVDWYENGQKYAKGDFKRGEKDGWGNGYYCRY